MMIKLLTICGCERYMLIDTVIPTITINTIDGRYRTFTQWDTAHHPEYGHVLVYMEHIPITRAMSSNDWVTRNIEMDNFILDSIVYETASIRFDREWVVHESEQKERTTLEKEIEALNSMGYRNV